MSSIQRTSNLPCDSFAVGIITSFILFSDGYLLGVLNRHSKLMGVILLFLPEQSLEKKTQTTNKKPTQ